MKIGIIQGRLTSPSEGHQTTPKNWEKEFNSLKDLKLSHIEWNLDKNKLYNNPLFKEAISSSNKKLISSVCFDNLVNKSIFEESFFKYNFSNLLKPISQIGIKSITLPLVEEARVNSEERLTKIKHFLDPLLEDYNDIIFNIEADSEILYTISILEHSEHIKFTYDTGNITASGFDHNQYIESTIHKINNVHLKDRYRNNGISALSFSGDTDFDLIFDLLSKHKYDSIYTLQMARGKSGNEEQLIKYYLKNFREKHAKYF